MLGIIRYTPLESECGAKHRPFEGPVKKEVFSGVLDIQVSVAEKQRSTLAYVDSYAAKKLVGEV